MIQKQRLFYFLMLKLFDCVEQDFLFYTLPVLHTWSKMGFKDEAGL